MVFKKKKKKFFCFVLGLHYVAFGEDRRRLDKKKE